MHKPSTFWWVFHPLPTAAPHLVLHHPVLLPLCPLDIKAPLVLRQPRSDHPVFSTAAGCSALTLRQRTPIFSPAFPAPWQPRSSSSTSKMIWRRTQRPESLMQSASRSRGRQSSPLRACSRALLKSSSSCSTKNSPKTVSLCAAATHGSSSLNRVKTRRGNAASPSGHVHADLSFLSPIPACPARLLQSWLTRIYSPGDTFESNPTLASELKAQGVEGIIAFGIQSECCVESTCTGALAAGFKVTLLSGAHSTYDNGDRSAEHIEREVEDRLRHKGSSVVLWQEVVAVWEGKDGNSVASC